MNIISFPFLSKVCVSILCSLCLSLPRAKCLCDREGDKSRPRHSKLSYIAQYCVRGSADDDFLIKSVETRFLLR